MCELLAPPQLCKERRPVDDCFNYQEFRRSTVMALLDSMTLVYSSSPLCNFSCTLRILDSQLFSNTYFDTPTGLFCPSRWIRLAECNSAPGSMHGSSRKTWLAAISVMPTDLLWALSKRQLVLPNPKTETPESICRVDLPSLIRRSSKSWHSWT
jgi:hypothetical protein